MAQPDNSNSYAFSDDADIILRSSDNVDLYVIGALLRYVSSVFKDMFTSSASDNNEKKDNLPIVPVAEGSETLRLLLDLIYPHEEQPRLSDPIVIWEVAKATQKYMMTMIESKLKRQTTNSRLIAEKPLCIFAIATDLGWEEMAIDAARQTLTTPLEGLSYVDELYLITGAGFYRFLEYRHRCENSQKPHEEMLLPVRRPTSLIKVRTRSSRSDTHHSVHIEDLLSLLDLKLYTRSELSDLILRTPDGADFYVIAAMLRFSSPFFNKKFPLENPVMKDGLAVIDVQEDSKVLLLLLSFIYPTEPEEPHIPSADLYAQLASAARKYEMTNIENRIKKHAINSFLVTAEPLRMYAIACALGIDWVVLAKKAALNTLNTPFQELGYVDEMHFMSGTQLFGLMRYHFACADAACDILKTESFKRYGFGKWSRWQDSNSSKAKVPDIMHDRLKACPRGRTVLKCYEDGLLKGIAEATNKDSRSAFIFLKTLQYVQGTPNMVELAVSKVDLLSCL